MARFEYPYLLGGFGAQDATPNPVAAAQQYEKISDAMVSVTDAAVVVFPAEPAGTVAAQVSVRNSSETQAAVLWMRTNEDPVIGVDGLRRTFDAALNETRFDQTVNTGHTTRAIAAPGSPSVEFYITYFRLA